MYKKIDGTTKDDAKDLDLLMVIYYLIEYIPNYSETTGSLSIYSRDEGTNFNGNIANNNNFKYFEYKVKILK